MDTAERDDRVMTMAAEALKRPLGERDSFLLVACQNDPGLYQEVSEVVTWEERMNSFLRRPLIEFIDIESLDKPFAAGETISGRFDIIREIGDGGMGVVYEAFDHTRKKRIAIKCAKPGFSRLLSPELEGGVQVRHPNVCRVNDIHKASTDIGDLDFITMEFLDGETLLERLSHGRLESGEALPIARQLCLGLAEIHRSGILHRDLKPANVILSPGKDGKPSAVITDFGLAVNQDGNTDLIGVTPSYMAPELKQNGQTSVASDVYALGVILYEMVTGQKPFPDTAGSDGNVPVPIPPSKLVKHLPSVWDDAILPCLAAQPEKRPSANQILAVLYRPPFYRQPWFLKVAMAALVLLAVGGLFWGPIYDYLRPPDIKLVILGVQSAEDMRPIGEAVLRNVTALLAQEPREKPKFQLVPASIAEKKGVSTPEQAGRLLRATHVLEVRLSRDHGDIAVDAAVIDTQTLAHVRDYSGHFAESDLGDLSGGLAGLVSLSLPLPRPAISKTIASPATPAYESGLNYLSQDRYSFDQAIAQFQEAAHLDPHSPLPLAGLAEAYVGKYYVKANKQTLDEAQRYLQLAERLDPDSPRVLMASASLNTANGQYSQALQDCARVQAIEPKNAEAWIRSGYAYEQQHLSVKAQESYHKAIELDPVYYKSYEYLGGLYYYKGMYAEAEQQYRKQIEHAPRRLDGYADLGALLTSQFRYAEAEKIYRTALSIQETPENLNNLGVNLDRQKRDAEALPLYERAAVLLPASPIYWINIGDSSRRLGHTREAASAYQKVRVLMAAHLQSNPASQLYRAYMAYCLARMGRTADAESEIGQALSSAKDDQQVVLRAVLTYEALGNRALALHAATMATPDVKKEIEHLPDLADLVADSRFTK
jgi:serine/threonine protein kinase/tetratricopeptide (TPR) repeat protein